MMQLLDQKVFRVIGVNEVSDLRPEDRTGFRCELETWISLAADVIIRINEIMEQGEGEVDRLENENQREVAQEAITKYLATETKSSRDVETNDILSQESLMTEIEGKIRIFMSRIKHLQLLVEQNEHDLERRYKQEAQQVRLEHIKDDSDQLNASFARTTISNERTRAIKLPTAEIPKFTGDIKAWPAFWEVFKYTVHDNREVPKPTKLTYLRSVLTGKASIAVQSLGLTDDGYDAAVRVLTERYSSKTAITQALYQELKTIRPALSNRPAEMSQVYEKLEVVIDQLSTQGENVELLSPLLTVAILEKFHYSVNLDLENQKGNSTAAWTTGALMKTLREYLQRRENLTHLQLRSQGPSQNYNLRYQQRTGYPRSSGAGLLAIAPDYYSDYSDEDYSEPEEFPAVVA
jgi:hypothetical protein